VKLVDSNSKKETTSIVATIGFFDGVHLGHRFLIDQLIEVARQKDLPSAVITFPVHPRRILDTDFFPALLCGYDEKIARLATTGIDYCVSLDFTKEMSQLSAKEFIETVLKKELNVDTLLIGYDHRFGQNRSDGFTEYVSYGKEVGIEVLQASEIATSIHISSSEIRRALSKGYVERANEMLGYRYTISGQIVEGFKVGRTIGFPTANIKIWEDFKVVPAFGVYAVYVKIEQEQYRGMLYIGKRPTLHNGDNISLEVNIFDFYGDLYGKTLSVEFIEFVRPDQKFQNLEILIQHINQDKIDVQKILNQKK